MSSSCLFRRRIGQNPRRVEADLPVVTKGVGIAFIPAISLRHRRISIGTVLRGATFVDPVTVVVGFLANLQLDISLPISLRSVDSDPDQAEVNLFPIGEQIAVSAVGYLGCDTELELASFRVRKKDVP